ncbi:hypothetical protein GCM10020331_019960 [Ectobacillus funiculus]
MTELDNLYVKFTAYLLDPTLWQRTGISILKIIFIIAAASVVIRAGRAIIQKKPLKSKTRNPLQMSERRLATIAKLLEKCSYLCSVFLL